MKKLVLFVCLLWAIAAFINADSDPMLTGEVWAVLDTESRVWAVASYYDTIETCGIIAKIHEAQEVVDFLKGVRIALDEAIVTDVEAFLDEFFARETCPDLTVADGLTLYLGCISRGQDPYALLTPVVDKRETPNDVL